MSLTAKPDLQPFLDEFITPGIKAAIESEVRKVTEIAKAQASEAVERRIAEIMGGIAVHIANMVTAERFGQEIRITVMLPKAKE